MPRASRYQVEALLTALGTIEARRRGLHLPGLGRDDADKLRRAIEEELRTGTRDEVRDENTTLAPWLGPVEAAAAMNTGEQGFRRRTRDGLIPAPDDYISGMPLWRRRTILEAVKNPPEPRAEWRSQLIEELDNPDDERHGTWFAFAYGDCRCRRCRKAAEAHEARAGKATRDGHRGHRAHLRAPTEFEEAEG